MTFRIRDLRDGELRVLLGAVERAFGEELIDARFEANARIFETDRTLVAEDGDRVVGGASAFSFRLTVPGSEVGSAGVTAVGVLPTHRRRGILTAMMRRQLDDVRRRGEPTAILWASEGSIYQRFGYGLGTIHASIEVLAARSAFRQPHEPQGSLRLLTSEEATVHLPRVYDAIRGDVPGFIARTGDWWAVEIIGDPEPARRGAGPKAYVLHERDGAPDGYVVYRIRDEWDAGVSKNTLEVQELIGTSSSATADLWRFCFDHDLIQTVKGRVEPADHPLLLMLAEPRRLRLRLGDGLWLRIVDVPGALGARSYATAERLVLELADPFLPDQAGRWLIDTGGDTVQVTRTDGPADLAVDTTDLAALYLGAFSASQLLAAGRGRELRDGAAARADALFGWHRRPWCPHLF